MIRKLFRAEIVCLTILIFSSVQGLIHICSDFTVNSIQKTISSPGHYNGYYPENMFCQLKLQAPEGHVIDLRFSEFSMESCPSCHCDWLEIRDGPNENSSLIGRFCNHNRRPFTITSGGKFLFLEFHSDKGNEDRGFKATYDYILVDEEKLKWQKRSEEEKKMAAEMSSARDRMVRWLKGERALTWGWEGNTARALVALRLSGNYRGETQEDQLMAKQAQLRTTVALLRSSLTSNDVSMHVHALLATCQDPRKFYGVNLVHRLKEQVASSANVTHPVAYLALCNAGEAWPAKAVQDIEEILGSESDYLFLPELQSVAVMAVSCATNSSKDIILQTNNSTLMNMYESTVARFKQLQHEDGGFGSLHSTAAIVQALMSSGAVGLSGWNATAALRHLMRETGSSSPLQLDFLSAYLALPVLNGKTLADVGKTNCSSGALRKEKRDVILTEVSDYSGPKIRVRYSLFVGDQRDVTHSIALRVPQNFTAFQVMQLAQAEDPKYRFSWKTVSGRKYVYEVAHVANDLEAGKFWLLHVLSGNATEPNEHSNTSPDKVILEDGQHLVMWYRTVYF